MNLLQMDFKNFNYWPQNTTKIVFLKMSFLTLNVGTISQMKVEKLRCDTFELCRLFVMGRGTGWCGCGCEAGH